MGEPGKFRFWAAIASAALNGLLLAILLNGLRAIPRRPEKDALVAVAFPAPAKPSPPPRPQAHDKHRAPASSPAPAVRARPARTFVPMPRIPLSPPSVPLAGGDNGHGSGNGVGVAGVGGGGSGNGGEGNDAGSDAEWIGGKISNGDYPKAAAQRGAQGTVRTEITVTPDGHASNCRITGSSGDGDLDETTCHLILRRFRFRPATDDAGRAIVDTVEYDQEWDLSRSVTPRPGASDRE